MRGGLKGVVTPLLASLLAVTTADAQVPGRIETFPGAGWDVRVPAEVGLNADLLSTLSSQVGGSGMIIKDGYWVFGWGSQTTKRDWMSAAKPVTSTLLLFAVYEDLLSSQHELVGPYIQQEFGQSLSGKDSLMSFYHLAHMTSGYGLPADPGPGVRWGYNDYAIKLYSLLLANRVFGTSLDYAATHPARLGALQFEDGTIYSSRQGLGVHTSPRDFARIGWFWLNRGYWNGVQLLPDEAFNEFHSVGVQDGTPKTSGGLDDYLNVGTYGGGTDQTGSGPGSYGYNLWINAEGRLWPDAPHDAYQANGGWNRHVMTVIPSLKTVAIWSNSNSNDPDDFANPMNQALKLLTEAALVPFTVSPGWSIASPPIKTANMGVTSMLEDPQAVAFAFEDGRYVRVDSMEAGRGYMIHSKGVAKLLRGEHILPQNVPLKRGWNLVGVYHTPVTASEIVTDPPGIILEHVVEDVDLFNASEIALLPGTAYWVRASAEGKLAYLSDPGAEMDRPVVPASYRKRTGRFSKSERSLLSPKGSDAAGEGPR